MIKCLDLHVLVSRCYIFGTIISAIARLSSSMLDACVVHYICFYCCDIVRQPTLINKTLSYRLCIKNLLAQIDFEFEKFEGFRLIRTFWWEKSRSSEFFLFKTRQISFCFRVTKIDYTQGWVYSIFEESRAWSQAKKTEAAKPGGV